jgi:hypothetical protein
MIFVFPHFQAARFLRSTDESDLQDVLEADEPLSRRADHVVAPGLRRAEMQRLKGESGL